jgi:hypothetical protein
MAKNIVYLIEKIWTDSLENQPSAAVGYEPHGFVFDEEKAKKICAKGRKYTGKDCWAILEPMPEFRYKSLKQLGAK